MVREATLVFFCRRTAQPVPSIYSGGAEVGRGTCYNPTRHNVDVVVRGGTPRTGLLGYF